MNERNDHRIDDTPIQQEARDLGPGLSDANIPTMPVEGVFDDPAADAQLKGVAWTGGDTPVDEEGAEIDSATLIREGMHLQSVSGDDLGTVEAIYGYPPSTEPQWASVRDGDRYIFVPLLSASVTEDGLHVPYTKDQVKSSPEMTGNDLTLDDEMALYSHYNERRIMPAETFNQEHQHLQMLRRAA
jgi:hypothetical protein